MALNLPGEEVYVGTMAHSPILFDRALLRAGAAEVNVLTFARVVAAARPPI